MNVWEGMICGGVAGGIVGAVCDHHQNSENRKFLREAGSCTRQGAEIRSFARQTLGPCWAAELSQMSPGQLSGFRHDARNYERICNGYFA
jgi:hypothetical protein